MKAGNNFVIEFSTAAYEPAKNNIVHLLKSLKIKENVDFLEQQGKDLTNTEVDVVYRIYNRKQNGLAGNQLKFAINLYHTQSKMNINGKRVDMFINTIFDEMCAIIRSNTDNLNIINNAIEKHLSSVTSSIVQETIQPKKQMAAASNTRKQNMQIIKRHEPEGTNNSPILSNTPEIQQSTPNVHNELCPLCTEHVSDGIACDICDFWYHFSCIGIDDILVKENMEKNEYVCRPCNEDMLYMLYEDTSVKQVHNLNCTINDVTENISSDHESEGHICRTPTITFPIQDRNVENTSCSQYLDELSFEGRNDIEYEDYSTQREGKDLESRRDQEQSEPELLKY